MLIGIGGYAECGKDATADILVREHGFYKTYMSKPLENALLTLNPQIMRFTETGAPGGYDCYANLHRDVGYEQSKKNPEVRRLLQILGTEIGRRMWDEDVWVNLMLREIEPILEKQDVVVTGIRFRNELEALHENGGVAWWVDRPGFGPVNSHESDNTLSEDDFDVVIYNDRDLEWLAIYVNEALDES